MPMTTPHAIHFFKSDPEADPLWVVLPDDGTRGYVIGERWEVEQLRDALNAFLDRGQHEGEIGHLDPQLGYKWHTSGTARKLMNDEYGIDIPVSSISHACRNGHIKNAVKDGRDWRFPQMNFLAWVNNRPKPGRKPK